MTGTSWACRKLAFVTAAAISLGATAFLSVAVVYPKPVVSVLGPEWQCRRMAFLTSCTWLEQIQPVADRLGKRAARIKVLLPNAPLSDQPYCTSAGSLQFSGPADVCEYDC